jgi:tetratricopeptide (TPR) repeat protein
MRDLRVTTASASQDSWRAAAQRRADYRRNSAEPALATTFADRLFRQGEYREAERLYRIALGRVPGSASARIGLGNTLYALGQREAAAAEYQAALQLAPDAAPAHANLAAVLLELGRPEEAAAHCRAALAVQPENAALHYRLGLALVRLERWDEAEGSLREAVRLAPGNAPALNELGIVLARSLDIAKAAACFRTAVGLKPGFVEALANLGGVLTRLSDWAAAEVACRAAIDRDPAYAPAQHNFGTLLRDAGRLEEAEQAARAALRLKPDYAEARVNLAMTLLLSGRFEEGWAEYEWRWRLPKPARELARFRQPRWDGAPLGEKILLLHAEQGFGDTLQFCRYAPLVARRGRVVLEVPAQLKRLLAGLPGVEQVAAAGEALPRFDLHCPLLSLPHVLATTLATIPGETPYLQAAPERVAAWRRRFDPIPGFRVGLVWAGSPTMSADRGRSLTLDLLVPLAGLPGVALVSLQKGEAAGQTPPSGMVLHDWTEDLDDFAETAALIEALDLVIGVDTAVIHLAGALGRPVWLLNRFDRDWRWLDGRDDSPWYPTLRQFRQAAPGDWAGVLSRVRTALVQAAAG